MGDKIDENEANDPVPSDRWGSRRGAMTFQARAAIISLRYLAYSLSYLAMGKQEAASAWNRAALAYCEIAKVKIKSPIVQAALDCMDLGETAPPMIDD